MLMPVPQTLAKKLNKDVFQGETERERERERGREGVNVHTERWLGTGALQAGEEGRTGVCGERRKETKKKKKKKKEKKRQTLHQVESKNQRLQPLLRGREQGGAADGGEMDPSVSEQSSAMNGRRLIAARSSEHLNTCCRQTLNEIKLSHDDLRVHVPLLFSITNLL